MTLKKLIISGGRAIRFIKKLVCKIQKPKKNLIQNLLLLALIYHEDMEILLIKYIKIKLMFLKKLILEFTQTHHMTYQIIFR